jgi:hypothetical protein
MRVFKGKKVTIFLDTDLLLEEYGLCLCSEFFYSGKMIPNDHMREIPRINITN